MIKPAEGLDVNMSRDFCPETEINPRKRKAIKNWSPSRIVKKIKPTGLSKSTKKARSSSNKLIKRPRCSSSKSKKKENKQKRSSKKPRNYTPSKSSKAIPICLVPSKKSEVYKKKKITPLNAVSSKKIKTLSKDKKKKSKKSILCKKIIKTVNAALRRNVQKKTKKTTKEKFNKSEKRVKCNKKSIENKNLTENHDSTGNRKKKVCGLKKTKTEHCGQQNVPAIWRNRLRPRPLNSLRFPCFITGCQRCMPKKRNSIHKSKNLNPEVLKTWCDFIPGCSYIRKHWFNSSSSNTNRYINRRQRKLICKQPNGATATPLMSTPENIHLSFTPQIDIPRPMSHQEAGDEPESSNNMIVNS